MSTAKRYQALLGHIAASAFTPRIELDYRTPFELLVAVVLSAQCTDKRVNLITPALFAAYPTATLMAQASAETLYPYIRSVSYPRSKARYLAGLSRALVERFAAQVPQQVAQLRSLPGVGRKSAHVVAAYLFGAPTIGVDTHVFRVARRLGLAPKTATTPVAVEKALTVHIPPAERAPTQQWLVLHGRYVCKARKPACDSCALQHACAYFQARRR